VTFEVAGGCFGYDKKKDIVKDISFTLEGNTVMSVLGPNGVGKTTLIKCMLGLLKWTSGQTLVDGGPAGAMAYTEFWKKIGYVPQAKLSAFAYSVEEMVLLGRNAHLGMTQLPGEADVKIALECMDIIGIRHLRHKICSKISGGELQMVLIARALAAQPSILVLDEPESNLDFRNQLIVLETIKNLSKTKRISSIINTHYPEHALSIADTALLLRGDGTGLYDTVSKVVTEPHLKTAFGVNVKIREIELADCHCNYTCVMPLSLA
jgi:iron complex transport system ATP-binding protein